MKIKKLAVVTGTTGAMLVGLAAPASAWPSRPPMSADDAATLTISCVGAPNSGPC
jgi:hypothetical protein